MIYSLAIACDRHASKHGMDGVKLVHVIHTLLYIWCSSSNGGSLKRGPNALRENPMGTCKLSNLWVENY